MSGIVYPCLGHPAYITLAHAVVKADGSCHVTVQFDLLAYALNDTSARIGNEPMEALLKAPPDEVEKLLAEAKERFRHSFTVLTERGPVVPTALRFPTAADLASWRATAGAVLPVVIPVEVDTTLPAGATTLALRFPGLMAETILTVERPGEDFFTEPVEGGKTSTELPVHVPVPPPSSDVRNPTHPVPRQPGPSATTGMIRCKPRSSIV